MNNMIRLNKLVDTNRIFLSKKEGKEKSALDLIVAKQQIEFDRNNLHALINNTDDLMWSVDRNFNLITSNQPFNEMVKFITGHVIEIGSNVFLTNIPLEQSLRFKLFYERAFDGEIFSEIEYTDLPVELWSEISFYPIRKGEEVIGTACHSRNITELKKAEKLLAKSEIFNRSVLNSLSSHIAVVNEQGDVVAVNESWKRFSLENGETTLHRTGVGSNYFKVCTDSQKLGDELAVEALAGMKNVIEGKTSVFYLEYPCDSLNKKRWFGMRVVKFENEEQMIVIAHEDISERKLAEETLIGKNEELLKANEELDRFVYSASHDLRSPLTSILGLVSFIEEETKEPDTLQHVKMIRNSINRLYEFIKKILSYSRNNRTELEVEKIPLQKTVEEIVDLLRNMNGAEGIDFEVAIHEGSPFYSDKQRFSIVMENIISNAIKYHKNIGEKRYIQVTGKSDKDKLHLLIKDNGTGIAPKNQIKVFDMFFRLSNKIEGSGIGLYIVKETVKKLQGSIELNSEQEKGTTLTITLKNFKE